MYKFLFILLYIPSLVFSQSDNDSTQNFRIRAIKFEGCKYTSKEHLKLILGIQEKEILELPGTALSEALKKLWKTGLINDATAEINRVGNNEIDIIFHIVEHPILGDVRLFNVSEVESKDLLELCKPFHLKKFTVHEKTIILDLLQDYMHSRGYYFIKQHFQTQVDSSTNRIELIIHYDNRRPTRVRATNLYLNNKLVAPKDYPIDILRPGNLFTPNLLEEDKQNLLKHYQEAGYYDAEVNCEITTQEEDFRVQLKYEIISGPKYYIGKIDFTGNSKFPVTVLRKNLSIKSGDPFSESKIIQAINLNPSGTDLGGLYMNQGHMFFRAKHRIDALYNDTIDIIIDFFEGPIATVKEITFKGNKKTIDLTLQRYASHKPGDLFSRKKLFITQHRLSSLPYIDNESVSVNPILNEDSTVTLEYSVKETTINDRIYASGGWGGSIGLVGTIGLDLNNFSLRHLHKFKRWDPLPVGQGQFLSLKAQSNIQDFKSYSFSFREPWIGKSPNSLALTGYYSKYFPKAFDNGFYKTSLATINYTRPLPNGFALNLYTNYTRYNIRNSDSVLCVSCSSNKIMFGLGLQHQNLKSTGSPFYLTEGHSLKLGSHFTPMYSLIDPDIENRPIPTRYKWMEYIKFNFDYEKFSTLFRLRKSKKVVLATGVYTGLLAAYNSSLGVGPFERFVLGGDGLSGFNSVLGQDFIRLRGYDNNSITTTSGGGVFFEKLVAEIRYPLISSPKWSLYTLGFFEAGNTWGSVKNTNILDLYSSAGAGVRIELNQSQVFGIDIGKGFKEIPGCDDCNKWQPHFTFGFNLK